MGARGVDPLGESPRYGRVEPNSGAGHWPPQGRAELPEYLLHAGGQFLTGRGDVPSDTLAFLPSPIDDLNAREALRRAGSLLVDEFGAAIAHGHAIEQRANSSRRRGTLMAARKSASDLLRSIAVSRLVCSPSRLSRIGRARGARRRRSGGNQLMVRTYSALLIGELGPDARDVELGAGAQRVELQLERRGVGDRVRGLLSPAAPSRAPSRAASAARTADLSFFGCLPGDLGFILKPDEAAALLEGKPPSWRNVIRPYPIGNDLTKDPEQRASRWVIDFGHRTLEQAMQFSPRPSRTSGSASSRRATRSVDPHTGATGGASRSR